MRIIFTFKSTEDLNSQYKLGFDYYLGRTLSRLEAKKRNLHNRPFSHCLCACVYRSRGALFLDNRRDFTEMGQTDLKPLILSM